tara:strand:- start:841 stop:1458 length:618 start_codon:yes stop_codon:yes gene_type:complete
MTFDNQLKEASYLIGLAGLFDLFDGATARWLSITSKIGKQLDSLADLVSFGLVPGAIVFHLIENSSLSNLSFFALLIPVCSALRLAKFNIDERQEDYFIGLPTPANSFFFCSIPLIMNYQSQSLFASILHFPEIILVFTGILSWALVSELALFSFKFRNINYKENTMRFNFLALSLILLLAIKFSAIPILIVSYIIYSALFFKKA